MSMRLGMDQFQRQVQVQTQKQILSPRMIQSMEILQLPILALQERIDQELLDNPTLESVDSYNSNDDFDNSDHYGELDYSQGEFRDGAILDANGEREQLGQEQNRAKTSDKNELDAKNSSSDGESNSLSASESDSFANDSSSQIRERSESRPENETVTTSEHELEEHDPSERELVIHENGGQDDFERLNNLGDEYSTDFSSDSTDYSPDYYGGGGGGPERRNGNSEEEAELYNNMLANMEDRQETLQDHLISQLTWFDLSNEERQTCEKIICNLDERGFFTTSLDEIFPGSTLEMVQLQAHALEVVQQLDPRGVGARDVRECLLLQLNPDQKYYTELKTLIENHLVDLEYNRLPQISKATGYSIDFLQTLLEEFKAFNPSPGRAYEHSVVPLLVPDVYVTSDGSGGFNVSLEDQEIPQLRVSSFYRKLENNQKTTQEERDYIHRKLNSAQWLIESIEQRKNTILKVCQAIVDYQKDFLNNGPEYLKPLKMQQIADQLGIHVATVSRTVDDKWMQTPRGVYPLRSFFVGGLPAAPVNDRSGDEEDTVAWSVIQGKIKDMVNKEDKSAPLSDDTIMERLAADGIVVARRTIAKYRKKMNIPSSRQRRDWSLALKKDA